MIPFVRTVQAGTEESSRRSDILKPLVWPFGLCLSATVSLAVFEGPLWTTILTAVVAGIIAALYIAGYVYFAIKQPDALRSESYTLRKMAIERGLVGDSATGLTGAPLTTGANAGLLPSNRGDDAQ